MRYEKYDLDGFSDRLKLARKKARLKQCALCEIKGLTSSRVSCLEHGVGLPTVRQVVAIAKMLDVSPTWLIFGIGGMYDDT